MVPLNAVMGPLQEAELGVAGRAPRRRQRACRGSPASPAACGCGRGLQSAQQHDEDADDGEDVARAEGRGAEWTLVARSFMVAGSRLPSAAAPRLGSTKRLREPLTRSSNLQWFGRQAICEPDSAGNVRAVGIDGRVQYGRGMPMTRKSTTKRPEFDMLARIEVPAGDFFGPEAKAAVEDALDHPQHVGRAEDDAGCVRRRSRGRDARRASAWRRRG